MAKFIVLHQLLPTHNKIEELTNELLANKFRLHIYTESSRKKTWISKTHDMVSASSKHPRVEHHNSLAIIKENKNVIFMKANFHGVRCV